MKEKKRQDIQERRCEIGFLHKTNVCYTARVFRACPELVSGSLPLNILKAVSQFKILPKGISLIDVPIDDDTGCETS